MKIGLYTIHSDFNYGAVFQAYALQIELGKLGYDSELVFVLSKERELMNNFLNLSFSFKSIFSFFYSLLNQNVRKKIKRFKKFHRSMKISKRYYSVQELYSNPPNYDIHLVGSDQVWNLENGFSEDNYYFLDFLPPNQVKIAFSSSFGTEKINENYFEKLNFLLSSFKAIAVREDDGVNIIRNATGNLVQQVLDPTFLIDSVEWDKLDNRAPLHNGEYIFCYGFDNSFDSKAMIESIKIKLNLPIVVVSVSLYFPLKVDKFYNDAGPKEFINLVRNAKFVCSSSLHGIAFAIHYRKPFFCTVHETKNSRLNSLLKSLNLQNRQLNNPSDILFMSDDQLLIDYSSLEEIIYKLINNSKSWLTDNLK